MSSPYNEVEDSRHADILYACFQACGHMTPEELSEGVVSIKRLREVFQDHIKDPWLYHSNLMSFAAGECNDTTRSLFEAITGKELPQ